MGDFASQRGSILVWLAVWLVSATGDAFAADTRHSPEKFDSFVAPLVRRACVECHSADAAAGMVDLEALLAAHDEQEAARLWGKVASQVDVGVMPPLDASNPLDADERRELADWAGRQATRLVERGGLDPGRSTLRRLNRDEYSRTIRDLLGVDFKAADDFPADDIGYGFDNIADVLSVSPLLFEKYLAAAETIARRITPHTTATRGAAKVFTGDDFQLAQQDQGVRVGERKLLLLTASGSATVTHHFAQAGDYAFRIAAFGEQAGNEPVRMGLAVDATRVESFAVESESGTPGVYRAITPISAGTHTVAIVFENDFYDANSADERRRDRNLALMEVAIDGPLNADVVSDATPPALDLTLLSASESEPDAVRDFARRFATRAWRRPVAEEEVDRLAALVADRRQAGASLERGLQAMIQAILASPHFVFRVEEVDSLAEPRPVDEWQLATRLSYFLWSTMPDERLFDLAARGELRARLDEELTRMLADDKALALVENFAGQWLQTRALAGLSFDPNLFSVLDDQLRADMRQETHHFFEHVLRSDRPILDFLSSDYTFVNDRLARHYGISGVRGGEFRRVSLTTAERGGVLTQAALLAVTSNPTRTSPVRRGRWVLENVLGIEPPAAPPQVAALADERAADPFSQSLRQRMDRHRADAACAACHDRMDPIGFGLENFDAIGRWRERDVLTPIDASGNLPSGEAFRGAAELKERLLARKEAFARCLAEKLLTYALGRGVELCDRPAIDQIVAAAAADEYRLSTMVKAVAKSYPFQHRRGETPAP